MRSPMPPVAHFFACALLATASCGREERPVAAPGLPAAPARSDRTSQLEQGATAAAAPCAQTCTGAGAACADQRCFRKACVDGCCTYYPLDCDDGNPCTADSCNAYNGNCVHAPLNAGACNVDGDLCTVGTCSSGVCNEPAKLCPAETDCKTASTCLSPSGNCSPQQNKADDTPCDRDGNACSLDACSNGVCSKISDTTCPPPPTACHQSGVCQAATGECTFAFQPSSQPCEDGEVCTAGDHCDGGGACLAGDYSSTVAPDCALDPAASTLTASTAALPVDGSATLAAHPVNGLGQPFPLPVTLACSFGTVGAASASGGDTLASVTSQFPGVSTCTAASDGQRFDDAVEIAFVGMGLTLAHAAAQPSIDPGGTADLVATLSAGATVATPGVTLNVAVPDGLRYVEGSARVQGAAVVATRNGSNLELRLPDLPAAPGETRVGYQLAAGSESEGIKPVVAKALIGGTAASGEAKAELTIGAVYDLGGCGCSQASAGAGSLGVALFAGLAAWLRRRRG